ncbi:biotin-dependent carboxyltransferase family protein [uncultured Jatrophihabitans sp.]|uniref:5-oxoprolinase subunit C family protein n=1 Tax=uncultured Jatrophihabitans sp. TaxID=1610747 RepID=UPI0035CBB521
MNRFDVLSPGPLTTVQDAGRPGHAHEGVSPSGYLDVPAATLANRLVGNDPGAALLETTMTGPTLHYVGDRATVVALTGAPAPLRVGDRAAPVYASVTVRPGEQVQVGAAATGLRSYLAVSGGLQVPMTLGSRSTDLLGGLGPPPLRAGDRLALGKPWPPAAIDVAPVAGLDPVPTLRVVPGPRQEWLVPDALDVLTGQDWTVSDRSNRVGVRLSGGPIAWATEDELPSEGMTVGAVQILPNGQPVIFLADHPVTGGYPVLAVLRESARPAAAQLRPGGTVRFAV